MKIDISISMHETVTNNKDPDSNSLLLAKYHQYLWSKKLNDDVSFEFTISNSKPYKLIDRNNNLMLSSDSIIHTYKKWKSMNNIIEKIDKTTLKEFFHLGSTIGGYILFPSVRIDNKPTINAYRGMSNKIKDRFDLTLECIRLYYLKEDSPLYEVLRRYDYFFKLFDNFDTYVNFFLLNDLVDDNYKIKFFLTFNNFNDYILLPRTIEEYKVYMKNVVSFVEKRNKRIKEY